VIHLHQHALLYNLTFLININLENTKRLNNINIKIIQSSINKIRRTLFDYVLLLMYFLSYLRNEYYYI